MSNDFDRGPEDYDDYEDKRFRYRRSEPRRDPEGSSQAGLLRWLLAIISSLVVSIILGAWSFTAQFGELRADVRNLKEQVAWLNRYLQPRYRDGPKDSDAN